MWNPYAWSQEEKYHLDDPIYNHYRLRSREEKYNYNTYSRNRPIDFFESQIAAKCALHSIHNLFRSNKIITTRDMNEAAALCAKESGDSISNHLTSSGNWSLESMRHALKAKKYKTDPVVSTDRNGVTTWTSGDLNNIWDDQNAKGFIIHDPDINHFSVARKNLNKYSWEIVDSMKGIENINSQKFYENTMDRKWNTFLVSADDGNANTP